MVGSMLPGWPSPMAGLASLAGLAGLASLAIS
jgi:hypothetical protein